MHPALQIPRPPPNSAECALSTAEVKQLYLQSKKERQRQAACRTMCATAGNGRSNNDSHRIQGPQEGHPRLLAGDAADSGIITETSWDAVTIAWDNGKMATVHHGDMREIQRKPTNSHTVQRQP